MDGRDAVLTIKSRREEIDRQELEYPIPLADAAALAGLRDGVVIEKMRHVVRYGGHTWEVDVFGGAHQGLVLAEIELRSEGEAFERPAWLGEEVTGDPRFYNRALARAPGIPPV
jgi:adenylate cyclase